MINGRPEEAGVTAHAQSLGLGHLADDERTAEQSILDRYLEDFEPGMVLEFGDYLMTEAEMIGFAQKYDPQPFHIQREPSKGSAYPTLIASGWHTGAATMRMLVDHFISSKNGLPSPGADEMRFVRPVHPGDRLHVRVEVKFVRPSASKPDRGIVALRVETLNQKSEVVLSLNIPYFVRRRPQQAA
jgi:acyl dehydratase